jgi:hypothetical protein
LPVDATELLGDAVTPPLGDACPAEQAARSTASTTATTIEGRVERTGCLVGEIGESFDMVTPA